MPYTYGSSFRIADVRVIFYKGTNMQDNGVETEPKKDQATS